MADKEVTTKLTLQGESGGMVAAMNKGTDSLNGVVGATQQAEARILSMASAVPVLAAALGSLKFADYIKDSTMLAARVETLGVVMKVVGNNAGYTGDEMERYAQGVAAMGITTEVSRQSVIKMASAHMDLNKASELARIAQDAAVIGNINSSEAFEKMVYGIQSGQTDVLKTIGINVLFEDSYKKLAATLGKTSNDLTENEKIQARTNVVLDKGKDIAGAYSASMDTAGKIINSMKRPAEETALSLGQMFTPSLNLLAKQFYGHVSDVSKSLKDSKPTLDEWGNNILKVTITVESEFMRLAMLVDKLGGTMTTVAGRSYTVAGVVTRAVTIGQFGKGLEDRASGMKEANDLYAKRYATTEAELVKLAEKYNQIGQKPKQVADNLRKQADEKPDGKAPKSSAGAWDSAHEKYLSYLEAFNARQVAIAKAGRDKELFDNEQGYANNLVSLSVYLAKKREAITDELNDELIAASNNLDQRQKDLVGKSKSDPKKSEAENAKEYHDALKEVEKATVSLTTVENRRNIALLKNSADSQKAVYADEVRLATLAENRRAAERADLDKSREFTVMRAALAGDTLTGELNNIEQERQAWINSWAMKVGSYEEYQQRLLEIETVFGQRRANAGIANEQRIAQTKLQINQNYLNGFTALANAVNTIAGGKNKILYALTQSAAIATTFLSTEAAAAAALAPPPLGLGPIAGAGLATSIKVSGYASMAAMAATTIANIAGIGSGSTPSTGTGGGTSNSPMVTQPVSQQPTQGLTVTFAPVFHGPVDQQALNKWTEDYFLPTLRDLKTRGVSA